MYRDYRVDIVLSNGTRRRGSVNLERPNIVKSANYEFKSSDSILEGATIVTANEMLRNTLSKYGFKVSDVNKGTTILSVRLRNDLAAAVQNAAAENKLSDAAMLTKAIEFWYENSYSKQKRR